MNRIHQETEHKGWHRRFAPLIVCTILLCSAKAVAQPPATQPAPTTQPAAATSKPASGPATSRPARGKLSPLDNFHVIHPDRAYRSALLSPATLRHVIEKYGIVAVINLRGAAPKDDWYQREQAACNAAGVQLIDVRLDDRAWPSREELLKLFDTFKAQKGPILMHCKRGADRSGLAAGIWRMVVLDEPREAAAEELSSKYGHMKLLRPKMDALLNVFEPRREWIEQEYLNTVLPSGAKSESADDKDDEKDEDD